MLKERGQKKLGVYGLSLVKRALCEQREVVSSKEGLVKESQELDKQHKPRRKFHRVVCLFAIGATAKSRGEMTSLLVHFWSATGANARALDACHATSSRRLHSLF
jgi:hypothetical protein